MPGSTYKHPSWDASKEDKRLKKRINKCTYDNEPWTYVREFFIDSPEGSIPIFEFRNTLTKQIKIIPKARMVLQRHLKRDLRFAERFYFIDEDPTNTNIDNLFLYDCRDAQDKGDEPRRAVMDIETRSGWDSTPSELNIDEDGQAGGKQSYR